MVINTDQRRKALEEKLFKDYQVDSLSQLPINFSGVLMQEDERYGNKVWDKHFGQLRRSNGTAKATLPVGWCT